MFVDCIDGGGFLSYFSNITSMTIARRSQCLKIAQKVSFYNIASKASDVYLPFKELNQESDDAMLAIFQTLQNCLEKVITKNPK